jgi:cytochrome c oxidase assembly factor CtaG
VSAALIVAAWIYVRGWVRTRKLDLDAIGGWHATSFLVGLSLIWIALASPVAALDHVLLTVHMVQHLLLMTLVPPLIWLGAPVKALPQGLPQRSAQVISSWFSSANVQHLGSAIARPAVCWLGAAGTLVIWHIPPVFMLGLQSGMWHGIEQASFFVTGLLFWWPVVRPAPTASNSPEWSILLYLFLATLPCDILSGFLVFCDRLVYPVYLSSPHRLGFSALEDQQCAGALMWTCVTVVYLTAGAIVAARLLSPQSSRQCRPVKSEPRLNPAPQTTRQSLEVV